MEFLLLWFFGFMMLMVFVWFIMITKLFNALRSRHPATYERIGKPSLFYNNSFQNNVLFLRFLWKSEFEVLNDLPLIKLCRFMRIFLAACLILYLFLIPFAIVVIRENPLK
jgi:hypothetical protein